MYDRNQALIQIVENDPSAILLLKASMTTPQLWRIAIENDPSLYQYCENPSDELTMQALEEDGGNLKYAIENKNVKLTRKMVFAAIKNYPECIFDIPKDIRSTEMLEYAFDQNPGLMKSFDNVRKGYIDRKLKEDPTFIRFLDHPTEDQVYAAVEFDPNYCAYIQEFTPRIKELINILYPDIIPLIPGLSDRIRDL